ncbi:hypothetical protein [Novosphingobium taihuense]|uniref:Spore coat protein U-like protein n=1 Tax=Novosphingobium taihuense TaxID=260085 RepID=A0A7W7AAQ9_9SPHN|nr:hypothetical protein [Novosphingobium taihuense]MBB4613417.1 hypothetical protein [Novosphingobium taihuense]TWH80923.1 hypothetical protein IQ25_03659 [Novosphingobium taihuense]
MKKILSLSILALVAAAAPAQAATDQQVTVNVDASLAQRCFFGTAVSNLTLSNTAPNTTGTINYECNFIGSPTVTVASTNGGLKPDATAAFNGATTVDYKIAFGNGVTSATSGTNASTLSTAASVVGTNAVTASNTQTAATLALNLPSNLLYAGAYADVLTFTIAP